MSTDTTERVQNIDLGKTRISDVVRVSSAAIWYEAHFGNYFQLETWIFSEDKSVQKSHQVIHGTCGKNIPQSLIDKTKKVHQQIANELKIKKN